MARQDLITERLDTAVDAIRARLRAGKIGYADLAGSGHTVQVRIREAADIAKAKAVLAELLLPTTFVTKNNTSILDWLLPPSGADEQTSIVELSLEEPEPGLLKYTLTDAGIDFRVDRAVAGSITVIGRRSMNSISVSRSSKGREATAFWCRYPVSRIRSG